MFQPSAPSTRPPTEAGQGRVLALVAAIAIVTVLYVAREVFVPVALAVLLSFVLSPVILVLRKLKVPRSISVVSVVLVTFFGLIMLGTLVALQLTEIASDLPRYQQTMREKIQSVRGATAGSGPLERAMDMFQDLSKELDSPDPAAGTGLNPAAVEGKPIPVEVRQPAPGTLGTLAVILSPLLHPLTTAGIIFIFVIFILLQREDLRNRFVRLAGVHDLQRTTAALDDAGHRLARFFLAQVALNAAFGCVIGLGLWIIGVPSPILWGLLGAVLRFIPYVGAIVAAVLPILFAMAVDPGWSMALWTIALFAIVEPLVGHIIEPLLYGRSTGLSPVAVIAAVTFWTWLWGPIGLVLSTPLTLCLVVLGRHVDHLEFLDVALGDRPPLSAPELFYQRMLAGDPLEAAGTAEEYLKDNSLVDYCDAVALPALRLAQHDAARGALGVDRQENLRTTLAELLDYLPDSPLDTATTPDKDALEPSPSQRRSVIILAARSPLDDAAGLLLAHLLEFRGIKVETQGADVGRDSFADILRAVGTSTIVLSYLDTATPAHKRYMSRRISRFAPDASLVFAEWKAASSVPLEGDGPMAGILREIVGPEEADESEDREASPSSPSSPATPPLPASPPLPAQ